MALARGQICAVLARQGPSIGANDLWIAAQAQAVKAVPAADNLREFRRVKVLQRIIWLR